MGHHGMFFYRNIYLNTVLLIRKYCAKHHNLCNTYLNAVGEKDWSYLSNEKSLTTLTIDVMSRCMIISALL